MASLSSRKVLLHVYDLHQANGWLGQVGLGLHHSGVEVGGKEYTFNEEGVISHPPKAAAGPNCVFKETIDMGDFNGSFNEVHGIVRRLREEGGFGAGAYNVTSHNCNHFSNRFCQELVGVSTPPWLNRAAGLGGFFGLGGSKAAPVGTPGANTATGSGAAAAAAAASSSSSSDKKQLTEEQKKLLAKFKKTKK